MKWFALWFALLVNGGNINPRCFAAGNCTPGKWFALHWAPHKRLGVSKPGCLRAQTKSGASGWDHLVSPKDRYPKWNPKWNGPKPAFHFLVVHVDPYPFESIGGPALIAGRLRQPFGAHGGLGAAPHLGAPRPNEKNGEDGKTGRTVFLQEMQGMTIGVHFG